MSISPIVIYADVKNNASNFEVGPCFSTQSKELVWHLKKEVHLFVPPVFIKEAAVMNKAMEDPDFMELVSTMTANILGKAKVVEPVDPVVLEKPEVPDE
ncbi:MAG: hypothetical protein HRT35_17720 [Algicola sp.]|nr:hypothetical protein [Algicola sp.]